MILGLHIICSILFGSVQEGNAPASPMRVHEYVGESMHYKLSYGLFNIGVASISCYEDQAGCGYIIRAEARSIGILKVFKNLHYRFECCMDPATGMPKSATTDLKDGRNISYNSVEFDYHSRTDSAIICSKSSEEQVYVVRRDIYDILTAYYHFRTNLFDERTLGGLHVVIPTFVADTLWDLRITYQGTETIETMYGQQSCQKFNSGTVAGKFFRHDDDMTVWYTEGEIPVPVQIQLNLKLGSITGELYKYRLPANPLQPGLTLLEGSSQ